MNKNVQQWINYLSIISIGGFAGYGYTMIGNFPILGYFFSAAATGFVLTYYLDSKRKKQ